MTYALWVYEHVLVFVNYAHRVEMREDCTFKQDKRRRSSQICALDYTMLASELIH